VSERFQKSHSQASKLEAAPDNFDFRDLQEYFLDELGAVDFRRVGQPAGRNSILCKNARDAVEALKICLYPA
jgi:hypothetical protein